ncbi:hypothetical protein [Deinococcus aerophilus]|uniref:Competence protein n=1 Tax=Deinococcus aerophilus TaxID=522488 RepID=A0ABQ2GT04_9DEIO|nr:hypothetical protein [Deinococcus aerophilus]GGM10710.1 hypothetical protein GCM10010841_18920 [Deinococcus aerophilus]
MTRAPEKATQPEQTVQKAPTKVSAVALSREMKLLLLLLVMVALIGAWYLWTSSRDAEELAGPQPDGAASAPASSGPRPTPAPVPQTVPVAPAGTPSDASAPSPALTVEANGPVEVETIPPFPTAPEETAPPAAPSGINPQAVVATAPSANPFRPLNLDEQPGSAAAPAPTIAPVPTASAPVSVPRPAAPVALSPVNTAGTGPLALSPIPGASGSVSVASGPVSGAPIADSPISGGALPIPVIPGGDGSAALPSPANPMAATPAVPAPAPAPVVVPPPKPIVPPVTGVRVPQVTRVPAAGTPAPSPAGATPAPSAPTVGTTAPGNPSAGLGAAGDAPTSLPTPGTPQVITQLGLGGQAAGSPDASAPAANPLEQYLQAHDLAFDAAVLGPVNTAIFRSKDGFVVVAVGQTLPDSQVTVKEVSTNSAVLALGNDLKTLALDKR